MNKTKSLIILLLFACTCYGQKVSRVEYFIDDDPGFGLATAMTTTAVDTVSIDQTIPLKSVTTGFHILGIRVMNSNGTWGNSQSFPFYKCISPAYDTTITVSRIEYFIDDDPGFGQGTAISINPKDTVAVDMAIPLTTVTGGFHTLYVRVQNSTGGWGRTNCYPFFKTIAPPSLKTMKVVQVEYFYDKDPGYGKAKQFQFTQSDSVDFDMIMPLDELTTGFHVMSIRAKNSDGWGQTFLYPFVKRSNIKGTVASKVVASEYYIDKDPGYGKAKPIAPTLLADTSTFVFNADLAGLTKGTHVVFVRTKDDLGDWSLVTEQVFCNGAQAKFIPSDSVICDQGFIQFANKTADAISTTTYAWDFNNDGIAESTSKNSLSWPFDTPGTYMVSLKVTEAGGACPNTFTRKIVVSKPQIVISAQKPPELYINDTLAVNATVDKVTDYYKIKWTTTGGTFNNDTSLNVRFTAATPGVYSLTATVTDIVGCTGSQTYYVRVLPLVENFIVKQSDTLFRSKQTKIATQYLVPENKILWENLNPAIASVNAEGYVTGVANGATIIRGWVDGKYTDSIAVSVQNYIPIQYIKVVESLGLTLGSEFDNSVYIYPLNASIRTVTWHTSDSAVAKVSKNGTVTPVGIGTCNIIVLTDDGNIPAVTFVTVGYGQVAVDSVVTPATIYTTVGKQVQLQAEIYPYYASDKTLEWVSTKPSVATVDSRGVVKASSVGQAYIMVNPLQGLSGKTLVIVKNSEAPVVNIPSTVTFYHENSNWTLDLNKYISDDNTTNQNLTVSISQATNFTTNIGTGKTVSFSLNTPTWVGNEVITFTVTDADGLLTTKDVDIVFSGVPNQAPQLYFPAISQTSAQTVTLSLAQYIIDDRDSLAALQVSAKCKGASTVSIVSSNLVIKPLSSSWTGTDTITISVIDTKGAVNTQRITYTVKAQQVLSAPQIQVIPVQYSNSFGEFADVYLNRYVKDASTLPENIYWTTAPSFKLDVRIKNNILTATPVDINWVGSERIKVVAQNAAGLLDSSEIIFIKQNTQEVKWEGSAQIDFFAERTIANKGSNITFYPNMTGARSWKWIITGNGETITSQALYPNINFVKNGVYDVSLVCQSKTNRDTLTAHNYISIFGISPADTAICVGSKVKLSINTTGLDTWKWNDGSTDNIITVSPSKTQYYKVHVTKDLFEYSDSIKVTVSTPIELGPALTLCDQEVKTIAPIGFAKFYWNNATTEQASFNAVGEGNISVKAIDTIGCISFDTLKLNSVKPLPISGLQKTASFCANGSIVLTAYNGVAYKWTNSTNSQTSTANSIDVTKAGTYYVSVTGSNGCSKIDTAVVTVNELPTVTAQASKTIVCQGDSVLLKANGAETYVWSNGIIDNKKAKLTITGNNSFMVTGTDNNGCKSTATVLVVVNAVPQLTIPSKNVAICAGKSVTFAAAGATTIIWDKNAINNQAFTPSHNETYIATGTSKEGCVDTIHVAVTVNALPTVVGVSSLPTVCRFSNVTLHGTGASSYVWSNNVKDNIGFKADTTTIYSVTGTDGNGCESSDTVLVHVLRPYREQIGVVTYDTLKGKKVIVAWNRHDNQRTERYILYRDNGRNGWDSIAGVPFNKPSIVVDSITDLDLKAYEYKLVTIDATCHNQDSSIHRTMHVAPLSRNDGYVDIAWNSYIGYSSIYYTVIRYNPDGTITKIADQSGNAESLTVTDKAPIKGGRYRVVYNLPETIYPNMLKADSGPFSVSLSNMAESKLTESSISLIDSEIEVYPNPSNGTFTVGISSKTTKDFTFEMYNSLGQKVFETNTGAISEKVVSIDATSFASGVYQLKIQTNEGVETRQVIIAR